MAEFRTRRRDDRYTRVAIALHWTIAALIVFNLAVGYFMEGWSPALKRLTVQAHVSSGITVLALTVVRVVWRLLHAPPAHPAAMKPWERHAAHVAHFLLYAAMVLMPLTGWAIVSAHPRPGTPGFAENQRRHPAPPPPAGARPPKPMGPPKLWWVVPLPMITPIAAIGDRPGGLDAQDELHGKFVTYHGIGGYLLIAVLLLHVAGAMKHQLVDRRRELARMGIGRTEPRVAGS